jgi:hypothetical protein
MRRRAIAITALPLFFFALTSCGGLPGDLVRDADGNRKGSVEVTDEDNAKIYNAGGALAGRVRGSLVRTEDGARVGSVTVSGDNVTIRANDGKNLGSFTGTICRDSSGKNIGSVDKVSDREAAAAGCLILLIRGDA